MSIDAVSVGPDGLFRSAGFVVDGGVKSAVSSRFSAGAPGIAPASVAVWSGSAAGAPGRGSVSVPSSAPANGAVADSCSSRSRS
jgi:hypothetical protein